MSDKTVFQFTMELPADVQHQAEDVVERMGYKNVDELIDQFMSQTQEALNQSIADLLKHYLDEIEDELRWQTQFDNSQDALDILAQQVRDEYYAGKTEEFDPDTDPDLMLNHGAPQTSINSCATFRPI